MIRQTVVLRKKRQLLPQQMVLHAAAINSFSTTEKSALLYSIIESRNEQGFKQFWSHIQPYFRHSKVACAAI